MLLVTASIDRSIRDIFPPKHKVDPGHYYTAAIFSTDRQQKSTLSQEATLISKSNCGEHTEEPPICIRIARQVVADPYTQPSVLAMTSASSIHAVKHKAFKKSMQMLSTT